jgi:hypothetical protein
VDDRFRSFNEIQNCRRKRRFETEREADDAAYRARMEGRRLGIYQCSVCGGWHLTSRGDKG